jgi:hypothetical protein
MQRRSKREDFRRSPRRKRQMTTATLTISKANLEAALTNTVLHQLGYTKGEVESVELSVNELTPIKITYKELVN